MFLGYDDRRVVKETYFVCGRGEAQDRVKLQYTEVEGGQVKLGPASCLQKPGNLN